MILDIIHILNCISVSIAKIIDAKIILDSFQIT